MAEGGKVAGKRVSEYPAHPATPPPSLLFAYGTLMKGLSRHRFLAGASFEGRGEVDGVLLSLGSYPGLVQGTGRVHGELYRLDQVEVLADIDVEEGYNFERRVTDVRCVDGRRARAWVYWYRGPRARARPVREGDWRTR